MRLAPPCVIVLLLSGCGFNFQLESLLVDRRILGMSVDPPELIFGVSDFSKPIQVSALVVDPKDMGTPQTFTWSWCLPDLNQQGGYDPVNARCLEQSSTLVNQGSAPLSQMATQFDPNTALNVLLASTGSSSIAGLGGEPTADAGVPTDGLSTYLMFQVDVEAGASEKAPLFGITRAVLSTSGPGNRQPNHNPHLTGLTFDDQIWEADVPIAVKLKSCAPDRQTRITSAPGSATMVTVCEHRIFPVFDDSQIETYQVQTLMQDAHGNYPVLTLQEQLTFDWFSDLGSFTAENSGTQSNLGPQVYDSFSTYWIEPPALTTTSVHFWIVTQDDRGGESWDERVLTVSGD